MLYKQIQKPDLVMTKLGKTPNNVVSDEVRAARLGRQKELLLFPRHCAGAGVGSFGRRAKDVEYAERQGPKTVEQAGEKCDEEEQKDANRRAMG